MDFDLTDDQDRYRSEVAIFAERELNDDVSERDRQEEFSQTAWKKCAEFGIQGLPVPIDYGGSGADPLTIALAMEALGYACRDSGLIFSLNAQMWSCEIPLVRFGSEDQKKTYLPGLCDGSLIGVQAMTEPESGSDAFSMKARAVDVDGHFVLDGTKIFVTNAPIADLFVVFCATDPSAGFAGISAFLVERDSPGVTVGQSFHKMGLRTSPMGELVLTDCAVGREALLGSVGAGMAVFTASMDWERSFILASGVGVMQYQLERAVAYAKQRKQFGEPIGRFQAVSHRLVDMKVRLESARLLLYHLSWLKSRGKTSVMESAIVKLALSESLVQSGLDALQTFGGYGYMVDYDLERDVRDALGSKIYSGTSDIQRNVIARCMGL